MSLKFARFIHQQTPGGEKHGFSVYFYPFENEDGSVDPSQVTYTVAVCSKSDQFCRRLAREQCFQAEEHHCRVVDFPDTLATIMARCYGHSIEKYDRPTRRGVANRFAWVFKYFL